MKRTYDGWKAAGYQVVKGSKMVGRDEDGKPLFSDEQVSVQRSAMYNYKRSAMYNYMGEGGNYEGSMEETLGNPEWYKD